ncbi:MAG: hypothetical protein OXR62_05145 [Ahrensia sp.]|nr:hypothetical protein [Ahrensia sp.]
MMRGFFRASEWDSRSQDIAVTAAREDAVSGQGSLGGAGFATARCLAERLARLPPSGDDPVS